MVRKLCRRCGKRKTVEKFSRVPKVFHKKMSTCKKCRLKYIMQWGAKNRGKVIAANRRYRIAVKVRHGIPLTRPAPKPRKVVELACIYSITHQEAFELVKRISGRCAVCRERETTHSKYGYVRTLSVDHNHKTGRVRGLLCRRCNSVLGFAKDSVQLLKRLIAYLEAH